MSYLIYTCIWIVLHIVFRIITFCTHTWQRQSWLYTFIIDMISIQPMFANPKYVEYQTYWFVCESIHCMYPRSGNFTLPHNFQYKYNVPLMKKYNFQQKDLKHFRASSNVFSHRPQPVYPWVFVRDHTFERWPSPQTSVRFAKCYTLPVFLNGHLEHIARRTVHGQYRCNSINELL